MPKNQRTQTRRQNKLGQTMRPKPNLKILLGVAKELQAEYAKLEASGYKIESNQYVANAVTLLNYIVVTLETPNVCCVQQTMDQPD